MTYLVTGHFKFTSDGMARAQELMASIQQLGRTEPGMLRYSFYPDPNIEHGYFLFEEWESKAPHDDHFNRDEMQAWAPELFTLLAEQPQVSYFDAALSSTLEM